MRLSFATLVTLGGAALGAICTAALAARADELASGASAHGIEIHGAEETLRDFCRDEDGILWLVLPGGARYELVTSPTDPAISNQGDGAFHPFDEHEVRAALAAVRYSLAGVSAEVFLLPYPRRAGFASAAGPGLILLAPGVVPLSAEHQHAEFTHELGHVVHLGFMPDAAESLWSRYRVLRGISDPMVYGPSARHADRPHEIFAEDFRALFGDALANASGTIENVAIAAPRSVPGLEAFLLALASGNPPAAVSSLVAFPNPTRGALSFRRSGGEARPLDLFVVAGRLVATADAAPAGGGWTWRWDGLSSGGRALAPGVLLARLRGTSEPAVAITLAR